VPGLPYEDVFTELQSKGLGMTGATAGRGVAGDAGAIVGQQLATGGLAQLQPWKPFPARESDLDPGGLFGGCVVGEDGSLTDLDTGEPVGGSAAAARLLGNTLREMEGMGDVSLDGALRQLAGEGPIDLEGYPDRRLASVIDAGLDQASDAGRGLGLPTSDDPRGGPLSMGVPEGRSAPRAAPPPFSSELGRLYGGYEMPAPVEPPSIFDTSVFGSGAAAGGGEVQATPGAMPAPVASASPGRVDAGGGVPHAAAAPPSPPPDGVGTPITAPVAAGAVSPGAPVARGGRVARPPASPPVNTPVPFELSPAGPQFPYDSRGAPAPDETEDGRDEERRVPGLAENIGLGVLGAAEAVVEIGAGTLEQMAHGALYQIPTVGVLLFVYDIDKAAEQHGGGVRGVIEALNEKFNPAAGFMRTVEEAAEAYDEADAQRFGNRMFKATVQVLSMVAILRGGLKKGALGEGAAAAEVEGVAAAEGGAAEGAAARSVTPADPRGGKLGGSPTEIKGSTETRRALRAENEAAEILAEKGYNVEQNPEARPNGRQPDYKIEGQDFDAYSPSNATIDAIRNRISKKIKDGQAERVVVNLSDSPFGPADVRGVLIRKPIRELIEVLVIKDNEVVRVFP
jgi:hypothetical protein